MSTQYDKIQGPYDYIRGTSISLIEKENVQTTIAPFIRNARVLELACGSAYYSYDFLKWGARAVFGVDISPVMLEEARRRSPSKIDGSIDFILADCSTPTAYPGGPFDVVFGAWLLNYAADRAALVEMFRNIALNLRDGGHFVSVTVPPAEDTTASLNAEFTCRPPPEGSGRLVYFKLKDIEDGIYFNNFGDTPVGDVSFDCYHLRKSLYEEAAREAGLKGELTWGVTKVPKIYLEGKGAGGASVKELESYVEVPNYGLLVIAK